MIAGLRMKERRNMTLKENSRTLPVILAAAMFAALPSCAGIDARPEATAIVKQTDLIPFRAASVARIAGTTDSEIRWSATGAQTVTVYAGTDPDNIDRKHPVGQGAADATIRVTGLAADKRWFFQLVPDHGAPLVIADHGVHLKTVPNLRDIGGYRTADGRWVKMGLLYRSDQLDRLSDADLAAMGNLGIRLIADLRTSSERTREPDRIPAGAEHLVLDVAADSKGGLGGDMRQAMSIIAAGKGAEMLTEGNRDFVSLGSARTAYSQLLSRIGADTAGPTLYHCTAGKDRTGWASAVILTLLGVPRETVMADYLASNDYLREKNAASLAALAASKAPITPENLEPVLGVRAAYLEAAFAEVDQRYGSFSAYARDALGLDAAAIERLRARYLAGKPE
ncbi:protein-tyrosine phosphatase [Sphingomonas sp. KC8]|nr:protein-tyrosine phosphatase [Sphingomonas sp. KC8]